MHRFFLPQTSKTITSIADQDIVHQLSSVLRMEKGEEVTFFNGDGNEYIFHIENVLKKEIRGKVVRVEKNSREPKRNVTLYCAILKRENFELVCQKATEVGVSAIVPLLTERTVKTNINIDRLKKIIKEASEQSGRGIIPEISTPKTLREVLKDGSNAGNIFFDTILSVIPNKVRNPATLRDLSSQLETTENISIFIGPEGGWSETERENAKKANCTFASLGSLTLRGETAAIVATYLAVQKLV